MNCMGYQIFGPEVFALRCMRLPNLRPEIRLYNLICLSYGILVENVEAIFIGLNVFRDDRVERCYKRRVEESISRKKKAVL